MTQELTTFQGLLDVQSGELLEPTVGNAGRVISNGRAMVRHVQEIINEATAYLATVAQLEGTKTLHGDGETITLSGGPSVEYDPSDLMEALAAAGCPQERINAAVTTTVTYKVNRSVLRQLAGANEDYKAAIELAKREVEKPFRATVELRRQANE